MILSIAVEGIWMWDVERSGKVERLLALASRNQQFLSHDLYAGVVRQLQVVDAGHDWGEEVIRVLRWLKCLPHNRQRGIQAPETWGKEQHQAQHNVVPQYLHKLQKRLNIGRCALF